MSTVNPQEALLKLLQIEREARRAESFNALGFTLVNAPRQLLDYQQAVLWHSESGVLALSGLSKIDNEAPFVRWLHAFLSKQPLQRSVLQRDEVSSACQLEWQQWLPEYLWCEPLPAAPGLSRKQNQGRYWLILARGYDWTPAEQTLLAELGDAWGYAISAFRPSKALNLSFKFGLGLILAALVLMLPVRQTLLAPVEVVAIEPRLVRVSIDGVIDQFLVKPNQRVEQNQVLFELDKTSLNSRVEVARTSLAVAEADLRQVSQQALVDPKAKALLILRKGDVERRQSELAYLEQLSTRLAVKAPVAGIAVFSDQNAWLGRAVQTGEKVIEIADPQQVEFQLQLPVVEMMPLPEQADINVYLNVAPDNPIAAQLHYLAYQAEMTPENVLAYRVKAKLKTPESGSLPRVGLRGTARIYGERVSIGYWLFRKPWSWARQWLGGW